MATSPTGSTRGGPIYYAQHHVRRYTAGLHPVNVVALLADLALVVLHQVQTQVFYDGLAQDVSIFSSQGSVVVLLVVVLLMENRRRGMIFGRPAPVSAEVVRFLRTYHGYPDPPCTGRARCPVWLRWRASR